MSDTTLCAKIIWKIENFQHCQNFPLNSEKFVVNTLDKSSWYLEYYDEGEIFLNRASPDNVNHGITVKVELAVLDADNEPQFVTVTPCKTYELGNHSSYDNYFIPFNTVRDNTEKYLRSNTFTIRCRMWVPENQCATHTTQVTLLTKLLTDGTIIESKIDQYFPCETPIQNCITSSRKILMKDVVRMYRDGSMSDFSIQVKGQTFPVHSFILASRSPVFHRMLQTNMKEKNDKILKLDELDEDTVRQMLEYMYSGDPGDLNAESALKLYYVGDQYQMSSLKEISAQCLMEKISCINACDIFKLADQHNDADLKSFATQFIGLHEKEIVLSEDFETLFESNHKLCWNILKELTKSRLG